MLIAIGFLVMWSVLLGKGMILKFFIVAFDVLSHVVASLREIRSCIWLLTNFLPLQWEAVNVATELL